MVGAVIIFLISLVCVVALFGLKAWELSHRTVFFPSLRQRADVKAVRLKELAFAARLDLAKVLPVLLRFSRVLIHEAALGFAALARSLERGAHRVADLVSHKRHYERRETRSEFLKKVAERGEGGLDTTEGGGHNS